MPTLFELDNILMSAAVVAATIIACPSDRRGGGFWKWYAKLGGLRDGSPPEGFNGDAPVGLGDSAPEAEAFCNWYAKFQSMCTSNGDNFCNGFTAYSAAYSL